MRIAREGGRLTLRDRPAPFWALGLFLLSGGLMAVAMPLGLATNAHELEPWEKGACITLGLAVIAGALWHLARSSGTRVDVDLGRRRVDLVRLGVRGRMARSIALEDVEWVAVEQGEDSEGGTVWRPVVRLRAGEDVRLSELWSHDRAGVEQGVAAMADACRVPIRGR